MVFYTIGYQERNLDEFIKRLQDFGINILVDVREIPFSRKKGFSKTPLSSSLKESSIEYVHLKELGSPKTLREKVRLDGDYEDFFKKYLAYVRSQMTTIEKLHGIISKKLCCIMCYERLPENCHRRIIAEKVKEVDGNGLMVQHI